MRGLVVKKTQKATRDYSDYIVVHTDKYGIYYARIVHKREGNYPNEYERSINYNWIYRLTVPNFYKRFKPKIFESYVAYPKKKPEPEWDQELIEDSITQNMIQSSFLLNLNGGVEI